MNERALRQLLDNLNALLERLREALSISEDQPLALEIYRRVAAHHAAMRGAVQKLRATW